MRALERFGLRPLLAGWVVLAVVSVAGATDAVADRSTAVRIVLAVAAYGGWAIALGAMLVPRSSSLTIARVLVPAGAAGAIAAASERDSFDAWSLVIVLVAAACVLLVWSPEVTDAFVDGSSYGPERRFALRTPPLVLLLAAAAWCVAVAGALAGPLLLASGRWVVGAIALAVGWPSAALAVRSLHQLSRRWIVLVPAGMVVHDPLTLPEAQLFLRQTARRLGPATVDAKDDGDDGHGPETEDLTAGATGLAIALEVSEPVDLLVRAAGEGDIHAVDRVLFTPCRPVALLDAARGHRLPVG